LRYIHEIITGSTPTCDVEEVDGDGHEVDASEPELVEADGERVASVVSVSFGGELDWLSNSLMKAS